MSISVKNSPCVPGRRVEKTSSGEEGGVFGEERGKQEGTAMPAVWKNCVGEAKGSNAWEGVEKRVWRRE